MQISDDETIEDIIKTMNEKQKHVMCIMVAAALMLGDEEKIRETKEAHRTFLKIAKFAEAIMKGGDICDV